MDEIMPVMQNIVKIEMEFKEEHGFKMDCENAGLQKIKIEKNDSLLESLCRCEEDEEIKPPLQVFIQSNDVNKEEVNSVEDHPVVVFDARKDIISPDHRNNNVGAPYSKEGIHLTDKQNLQFCNERNTGFSIPKSSTKQSQETQSHKKVLTSKMPVKTGAERSREYRARKKALQNAAGKHLTSNECAVNQELLQKHLVGNEIHICENNHPLLYEHLNRRNSNNDQGITNYQSIVQADMHQESPLTGYYPTNSLPEQSISKNVSKTLRKPAKTPAERSREYRMRQKALKNFAIHHQVIRKSSRNIVPAKTPAERSREYRLRQKALKNVDIQHQVTCKSSHDIVPNDVSCLVCQKSPQNRKIAKTSAERSRKYRLRMKALSMQNDIMEQLAKISSQTGASNNVNAVNRQPIFLNQQDLINNIFNTPTTFSTPSNTNVPQNNELYSNVHGCLKDRQEF